MKLLNSVSSYFKGVYGELRKVVWPSAPTLLTYLVSVVVGIALATAVIGIVDYLVIQGISFFITK